MKSIITFLWKKKFTIFLSIIIIGVLTVFLINLYIIQVSNQFIYQTKEEIPDTQVGLILGASVNRQGIMSDILEDRAIKGLELYKNKKVSRLLVSGDYKLNDYDEVDAVKEFLLENDVPSNDIFLDYAGFDTYDSLYRAKEIFEIDSLIVVTQEFHLPRAVYIGRALGIETYGYIADRQTYVMAKYYNSREALARIKAFFNVILHSKPEFLGEKIPING